MDIYDKVRERLLFSIRKHGLAESEDEARELADEQINQMSNVDLLMAISVEMGEA